MKYHPTSRRGGQQAERHRRRELTTKKITAMKQQDETNVKVLQQLQEYAYLYFDAITALNPDLKPGRYSAKEMGENSYKSVFGHAYPLPEDSIFDETIEIVADAFSCKVPYRQIFAVLAQWEAMMKPGKLKTVFEIGKVEEKYAKVLLDDMTDLGAYKEKRVRVQRITGNWWRPRKISNNGPTYLYYELNGVMFVPGKRVYSEGEALGEDTIKWCERYDDAEMKRLLLSVPLRKDDGNRSYWLEVLVRAGISTETPNAATDSETPQISTEAEQADSCATEGEKREETQNMSLSDVTLRNMANYPDKWPTVMCYRELLSVACRKFGCMLDEAQEKYGQLTNKEWGELLRNAPQPPQTKASSEPTKRGTARERRQHPHVRDWDCPAAGRPYRRRRRYGCRVRSGLDTATKTLPTISVDPPKWYAANAPPHWLTPADLPCRQGVENYRNIYIIFIILSLKEKNHGKIYLCASLYRGTIARAANVPYAGIFQPYGNEHG